MRRIPFDLNGPRGLAALGVVVAHVFKSFAYFKFPDYDRGLAYFGPEVIGESCLFMFMMLAGMAAVLTKPPKLELGEYLGFQRRKFLQLIVPYLVVSLLTLVVKLFGKAMSPSQIPHAMLGLIIAPRGGPSAHLWFLYWLMTIFVIWPVLRFASTPKRLPILLGASFLLAIQPIRWPGIGPSEDILGLESLVKYLPVFLFGYYYGSTSMSKQLKYSRDICIAAVAYGACLFVIFTTYGRRPESYGWLVAYRAVELVGKTCGALVLLWLAGIIAGKIRNARSVTSFLAVRAYDVYLLHLAFAVHPIVFLMSKLHPGLAMTVVLFVIACIAAWLLSLFYGSAIRRVPLAGAILLGVPIRKAPKGQAASAPPQAPAETPVR